MAHREIGNPGGSILHVHNVAGVSSNLAFFQRKLGFEARVITRTLHPFGYEEEYYPQWKMLLALRLFPNCDIIHYHENTWFRRKRLKHFDYHLCKRFHKKMILHFHGRDLRIDHLNQELKEIIDDLRIVLVSTPDLLDFLPSTKGAWLPNPVNLPMWRPKPRKKKHTLIVGYYRPPQDERKKVYFFEQVELGIKALKRKGFNLEAKPIYWKTHRDMPSYYSSIDIYVDRLGMGWYGMGACEAMASGIPVITHVREDLRQLLPTEEPFLLSSKEEFAESLEMILTDVNLRKQLAQRGGKYVSDTHDGLKVAQSLLRIYQEL